MRALCEADSPDNDCPGCFASLRSVQGAVPLAPLMRLSLQIENLEQFNQRVHKYEDLQEMTPYALRELVKGIYIEAPDKSSGKRRQGIRISYDLVGFIPVDELMKQETA